MYLHNIHTNIYIYTYVFFQIEELQMKNLMVRNIYNVFIYAK
jgi:hypothetical protein